MVIERDKRPVATNQDTSLSGLANLKPARIELTPENLMHRYPVSGAISFTTEAEAEPAVARQRSDDSVPYVTVSVGSRSRPQLEAHSKLMGLDPSEDLIFDRNTSPLVSHSTTGLHTRQSVPSSVSDPAQALGQEQRSLPTRIFLN